MAVKGPPSSEMVSGCLESRGGINITRMRHIIPLHVRRQSCYAFVFNKCHRYLIMRVPLIVIIILNTDVKMYTDKIWKHKVRCRTSVI